MKDIISTVIALVAMGAFIGLPTAVALTRTETDRTASEGTIPQQLDPLAGDDA